MRPGLGWRIVESIVRKLPAGLLENGTAKCCGCIGPGGALLASLRTLEGSGSGLQNSLAGFSRWNIRVPFWVCAALQHGGAPSCQPSAQ